MYLLHIKQVTEEIASSIVGKSFIWYEQMKAQMTISTSHWPWPDGGKFHRLCILKIDEDEHVTVRAHSENFSENCKKAARDWERY